MPEIRPVTKDNWKELIRLKVREDQTHFVASNVYSIAEAQFGDDYDGHWDLHPFGIYKDTNTPVGFLMYGYNFEYREYQAFIVRLMVDEKHQGRAMGVSAWKRCWSSFAPMIASRPLGSVTSLKMKEQESSTQVWALMRRER